MADRQQSDDQAANRGLVWFGVCIGMLSALNVTAGATAALVGLLFAFVGGSLLTLYQGEDRLPADRRRLLFAQAGQVSKGLILGLVVGFGLRFLDNSVLRPGAARIADWIMPSCAATVEEKQAVSSPSNFELHADTVSAIQKVIDRCETLAAATNNTLTEQDRETLKRLATNAKGQLDLADALKQVRELTHSDRLEKSDQTTLRKELDDAFKRR